MSLRPVPLSDQGRKLPIHRIAARSSRTSFRFALDTQQFDHRRFELMAGLLPPAQPSATTPTSHPGSALFALNGSQFALNHRGSQPVSFEAPSIGGSARRIAGDGAD